MMASTERSKIEEQIQKEARYEDERKLLIAKYPNLRHNDPKLWTTQQYHPRGQMACITFTSIGGPPDVRHLSNGSILRDELVKIQTGSGPLRRLFLLEGCYDVRSTILGAYLRIPHLFWMRHVKVAMWESNSDTAGNLPSLPSTALDAESLILPYCQMMRLNDEVKDFSLRCAENERHIAVSRVNGRLDGVAAVHRKASFWARTADSGGWDAVIIVDAPFKKALEGRRNSWILVAFQNCPTPFQGGYADFIRYRDLDDMLQTSGPPRSSAFDDLLYYYSTHWSALSLTSEPWSVTLLMEKLVASEYVVLIQYYRALLSNLHWSLSRHKDFSIFNTQWVTESWSDLMSIQRRLQDHLLSVRIICTELSLRMGTHSSILSNTNRQNGEKKDRDDPLQDFNYVQDQLSGLVQRTEHVVTAFTALSGAKSAEQSLSEASSVRVLTNLGIIFLPLSLVAAIFSMTGQYGPGESQFWLYFAVAIPATVMIFLVASFLNFGTRHASQQRNNNNAIPEKPREYKEFRDLPTIDAMRSAASHKATLLPLAIQALRPRGQYT